MMMPSDSNQIQVVLFYPPLRHGSGVIMKELNTSPEL